MKRYSSLGIFFFSLFLATTVFATGGSLTPPSNLPMGSKGQTTTDSTGQNGIQTPNGQNLKTGRVIAVGDLNFQSGLGAKILADPEYPWANVRKIFETGSIRVGNLEVPLSNRGSKYTEKTWILRADPRTVQALVKAKFQVVTLANNHIMDFGPVALGDTIATLDTAGIAHAGAGMNLEEARRPALVTAPDGTRFAFLSYSLVFPDLFWAKKNRPGTPYGLPELFIADIKQAKTFADHVVVSFHWSEELRFYPKPYQKAYAHQCIDAGADIVLGHHPHVLQGLEVYKGGLIAYSLGNFAFGTFSRRCTDSIILAVDYDAAGLNQAVLYPVNVNNHEVNFQTRLRHGDDAERALQDLRSYSAEFKTTIRSEGDTGVVQIRE